MHTFGCLGARHFAPKREDGRQEAGIRFFMEFVNCEARFVAIENPVSIMSTRYRKPDQIIQPWQFGHGETKATCLWLKNLPPLSPTNIVEGRDSRILRLSSAKERSRTYPGIADAMAINGGTLCYSASHGARGLLAARLFPVLDVAFFSAYAAMTTHSQYLNQLHENRGGVDRRQL